MTRKQCKAGRQERIQKLLKGLANIRPEPVRFDASLVSNHVISSSPREQVDKDPMRRELRGHL